MVGRQEYERWLEKAVADKDLIPELKGMNENQIKDAFYRDLAFGTGGLRGIIGAGTNRMNVYTVAKATQGLAVYLKTNYTQPSIVIGYDSRIKSEVFAKVTAMVMADNGIKVHLWNRLLPVPTVSFATRYLHTSAGVMITASHNPSKYNGYKVYAADGCQITTEAAAEILAEIKRVDIFSVLISDFDSSRVDYIPDEVLAAFIEAVEKQSVITEPIDRNVAIVYTPLNGTGLEPVTRVLKETGFKNITVVEEQKNPDGNFPTCPYPNPEIREALNLGLEYCKKQNADLLIATDPDCDRCGIAVKNKNGEYQLLTGNETGLLLLDFICSQRRKNHTMPQNPVMIKTIVTSDLGEKIAANYGVKTINVLTGFKFIGEQIGLLEKQGKADDYIFGFEESYGYLTGSYVRDKDGVDASFMIAEMFAYYKTQGISLLDKLDELYQKYGYRLNTLHSYEFDGESGFHKMQAIMQKFRTGVEQFGGKKVKKMLDYSQGIDGLPKSDVLKYLLAENSSVVVRPSGTEPKLKVYISISAMNMEEAQKVEQVITEWIERNVLEMNTVPITPEESILFQALTVVNLIRGLAYDDFLNSGYYKKFCFPNNDSLYKEVLAKSGLGNPALLEMFLYILLVMPKEMIKKADPKVEKEWAKSFNEEINKLCEVTLPANTQKVNIDYYNRIRNAISHSGCIYDYNKQDKKYYVTFVDEVGRNKSYRIKISTENIKPILEKLESNIIEYLKHRIENKIKK